MTSVNKILLTGSTGMVGRCILFNQKSNRYKFLTPNRKELNLLNLLHLAFKVTLRQVQDHRRFKFCLKSLAL